MSHMDIPNRNQDHQVPIENICFNNYKTIYENKLVI